MQADAEFLKLVREYDGHVQVAQSNNRAGDWACVNEARKKLFKAIQQIQSARSQPGLFGSESEASRD